MLSAPSTTRRTVHAVRAAPAVQVQAHLQDVPAEDQPVLYHAPAEPAQLWQQIQVRAWGGGAGRVAGGRAGRRPAACTG